jgi:signal peptidase II
VTLAARWRILIALFTSLVIADQVTKFLAVKHLTFAFQRVGANSLGGELKAFLTEERLISVARSEVHLFQNCWGFRYAENDGAAWGLFARAPAWFRVPFFHVVSILAIGFILSFYRKLREDQRLLQVALSLVLAGAVGNFLDRILRGYVIDFVDWHWNDPDWMAPTHHWPTFNIADTGISVGVALMFLEMLLARNKPVEKPAT